MRSLAGEISVSGNSRRRRIAADSRRGRPAPPRRAPRETGPPCRRASAARRRRNWIGRPPNGGVAAPISRRSSPIACGRCDDHIEHLLELAGRVRRPSSDPDARSSSPKTSAFGRASPTRSMTGLAEPQADRAVAAGEVVALEERRRRQQHVGVARRVGHHLVEDDGEQVVALQSAQDAALVGRRHRGVRVVDEQQLAPADRRTR